MRSVKVGPEFDSWRSAARRLLRDNCPPESVLWQTGDSDALLFGDDGQAASPEAADGDPGAGAGAVAVPREFIDLARDVYRHRDPERFALLYRVLFRLTHGEHDLLNIEVDDDVRRLTILHRQVMGDRHRMLGFLRFEQVEDEQGELYFAWYQPDHFVLRTVAPEFVRRLRAMRWSILTPDESAHWDRSRLTYGPGVRQRPENHDLVVGLWKVYYAATYNPQRDNPKAFRRFVPQRFLQNMPEAEADLGRPALTRQPPQSP